MSSVFADIPAGGVIGVSSVFVDIPPGGVIGLLLPGALDDPADTSRTPENRIAPSNRRSRRRRSFRWGPFPPVRRRFSAVKPAENV